MIDEGTSKVYIESPFSGFYVTTGIPTSGNYHVLRSKNDKVGYLVCENLMGGKKSIHEMKLLRIKKQK